MNAPRNRRPHPPKTLRDTGRALWTELVSVHDFDDPAELATLETACRAADTAELARQAIEQHGILITTERGLSKNPAVSAERDATATMLRCFRALKLESVAAAPARHRGSLTR